jgi:hypothetical protein
MINYSGLPQRVRRIVKQYDYCIESVIKNDNDSCTIYLKKGYQGRDGARNLIIFDDVEAIYFLKSVVKPSNKIIKVALYGFTCPISGVYVPKGSNYIELNGFKLSPTCNLDG